MVILIQIKKRTVTFSPFIAGFGIKVSKTEHQNNNIDGLV